MVSASEKFSPPISERQEKVVVPRVKTGSGRNHMANQSETLPHGVECLPCVCDHSVAVVVVSVGMKM